jgi:hypothetical protein
MARTSGALISGVGVVAEQRNREQNGDVERQKQAPAKVIGPPITVEGRIEPTPSQLLSSRDVLREQNSIAPEPTIMLLDLSEAIAPITT